jgi:hypothetical protein
MAATTSKPTSDAVEERMLRRIPNSYDSAQVILDLLADGRQLWNTELQALVADYFGLTKTEREWIRPGQKVKNRAYFSNETAWALSRLYGPYGFITRPPTHKLYSITKSGIEARRQGVLVAEAEEKGVRTGRRIITGTGKRKPEALGADRSKSQPAGGSGIEPRRQPPSRRRPRPRPLATAYVAVSENGRAGRDPFEYDPDELDRQTLEHMKLQNALAATARAEGFRVFQPGPGDPVKFDLAWSRGAQSAVVEIKTLGTTASEAKQLRLGIGQVLDYRHQLGTAGVTVAAVIAVDRKPRGNHWAQLCADHGIMLAWPSTFMALFEADRHRH